MNSKSSFHTTCSAILTLVLLAAVATFRSVKGSAAIRLSMSPEITKPLDDLLITTTRLQSSPPLRFLSPWPPRPEPSEILARKSPLTLLEVGLLIQSDCSSDRPIVFINPFYSGFGSTLSVVMIEIAFAWSQGYQVVFLPDNLNFTRFIDILDMDVPKKDFYVDKRLCPGKVSLTCYFDVASRCNSNEQLTERLKRATRYSQLQSKEQLPPFPLPNVRLRFNLTEVEQMYRGTAKKHSDYIFTSHQYRPWWEAKRRVQLWAGINMEPVHNQPLFWRDFYKALWRPGPLLARRLEELSLIDAKFEPAKPFVCLHLRRQDMGADGRKHRPLYHILDLTAKVTGFFFSFSLWLLGVVFAAFVNDYFI
jgi:hypothetical protein